MDSNLKCYIDVEEIFEAGIVCAKCKATIIRRSSVDDDTAKQMVLNAATKAGWGVGEYDGPYKVWSLCAKCMPPWSEPKQ